jgi:phthalate 4,5-dioxygenase oxygenase subunit
MRAEENHLITRVENGAPMGQMLRENFWFPAALSIKILAGKSPLRVKLLGEQFVAFRASDGRVGFFDENCPHRRASLALARNEDNALRCIFHGWKFGVDGTVLEVPTQPHNAAEFCKKVPLQHYPVREAGGIVWVWLGKGPAKAFPDFEFNNVPEDQVYAIHQQLPYNWVQDVEGGLDSAHVAILHSHWLKGIDIPYASFDTAPTYEFQSVAGGYRYAAIRNAPDEKSYIRVNQFVMPWYAFICPEEMPDGDRLVIFSTPNDDLHTTHWMIRYNRSRPLKPSYANPAPDRGDYPPAPTAGPEGHWGQDRDAMEAGHFSGFTRHLNTEDFAVAWSQGRIADRSREFLNEGDLAVVWLRRHLLAAVREHINGEEISGVKGLAESYRAIKADALLIPKIGDWKELVFA